jgi:hypothetical protein
MTSLPRTLVAPEDAGDARRSTEIKVHPYFFEGREGELQWEELKKFQQFTFGYALTVHKSQGSQWNNVVLFDESAVFREGSNPSGRSVRLCVLWRAPSASARRQRGDAPQIRFALDPKRKCALARGQAPVHEGASPMTRPRVRDVRKDPPLSVKLAVALRMLGFKPEDRIQFDHDPALALREWDEEKRDFIPPQHDPEYIVIRTEPAHDKKTNGNGATSYGSDKHAIAKIDRVSEAEEALQRRLLAKSDPDIEAPRRPRSRIPPRRFSRQHRPLRGGSNFPKRKE